MIDVIGSMIGVEGTRIDERQSMLALNDPLREIALLRILLWASRRIT